MQRDQPDTAQQAQDAPTLTHDLDGDEREGAEQERYAQLQDAEWEEPEEMPARPRRKLLTPLPVALLAVLTAALGFWVGVKVQKNQGSSAGGSSSLASAFAGLRAGASTGKGKSSTGSSSGVPSGFPGAGGVAGGAGSSNVTTGEVTYVDGHTIYVSNSDGNTVKVLAGEGTTITETVTTHVHSIHPGDTVVVQGSKGSNGEVDATSMSLSSSTSSGSGTSSSSSGATSASSLFGAG